MNFTEEIVPNKGYPYKIATLELNRTEALLLINSLSRQLVYNNPARDRAEFHPDEGGLFTVVVVPECRA